MRDHGWRTWASYEASYISWKGTCQCDIRYDRASQFLKILFSLDGLRCWGALGPGGGGEGHGERKERDGEGDGEGDEEREGEGNAS